MSNLSTKLLGLDISSPVVLGASSFSYDLEKLVEIEKAGAGAIVFRTLFEEQMQQEAFELEEQLTMYDERNAEMTSIFPNIEHGGPKEHLMHLKNAKESLSIPIVASINCIYDVTWKEYAKLMVDNGASALELNFYDTPKKMSRTALEIEDYQVRIVEAVRNVVDVPIQVKLSRYYTNPLNVIKKMDEAGANGFVLFNRLFLPDIDIAKEAFDMDWNFTSPDEKLYSIRFAGLLYGQIKGDIISGTGIYGYEDVVSLLLAGADSVQIVSSIYKNGPEHITKINNMIKEWMVSKGYESLNDFKGKLSNNNVKDKSNYTRAQYVDILLNQTPVFDKDYIK